MTTKKQIHALLKHLLERDGGLILSKDEADPHGPPFIVVKPVRHVIRTLWIDRSGVADYARFFWAVGHAFNPMISRRGIFAEQFQIPRGLPNRLCQPGMREAFIDLVENAIVPMLQRVETVDDMFTIDRKFRSAILDGWLQYEPYQMHFLAANGRFEDAIAIYESIKDFDRSPENPRRRAYAYVIDDLAPLLLANDRPGVAALLHRWELATIQRNGLEAIYEPTPFPLELERA